MSNFKTKQTPFIVGLPVPVNQFFGREEQTEQFYRQCVLGPVLQPTRILGLKRSGKTSFLNYISSTPTLENKLDKPISESLKFIYVNAQSVRSPADFFANIVNALLAIIPSMPEHADLPETEIMFRRWLFDLLETHNEIKIIILIDEFEQLHDAKKFDREFFGFLRALASENSLRLSWVTASSVDLYTLDANQKTSPFWNIFHQKPIIMGGFSSQQAHDLIENSLASIGESISESEVLEILSISGYLPYFIQAVSDSWHSTNSKRSSSVKEVRNSVFDSLSKPGNQIQHIFRGYWDELNSQQKEVLKSVANEKHNFMASNSDLSVLSDFGLITYESKRNGEYNISGELLKHFIVENTKINVRENSGSTDSDPHRREVAGNVTTINVYGNISGSNIVSGNKNRITQRIQKSFNKAEKADIQVELKETLKALAEAVAVMSKELPTEQATEAADDLEKLVEEATKEKPNKKWYSVSIEGLIAAAENIGKVGEPVIDLSKKMLSLLTGGLVK